MESEFVGDGNGNGKVNFEVNPDRLAVQQRLEKLRPGEYRPRSMSAREGGEAGCP